MFDKLHIKARVTVTIELDLDDCAKVKSGAPLPQLIDECSGWARSTILSDVKQFARIIGDPVVNAIIIAEPCN